MCHKPFFGHLSICGKIYYFIFSLLLLLWIALYLRWPTNENTKIQKLYENHRFWCKSFHTTQKPYPSHMAAQFVIPIFGTDSCALYSHVRGSSKSPMCQQIKYSTIFRHLLGFFFSTSLHLFTIWLPVIFAFTISTRWTVFFFTEGNSNFRRNPIHWIVFDTIDGLFSCRFFSIDVFHANIFRQRSWSSVRPLHRATYKKLDFYFVETTLSFQSHFSHALHAAESTWNQCNHTRLLTLKKIWIENGQHTHSVQYTAAECSMCYERNTFVQWWDR